MQGTAHDSVSILAETKLGSEREAEHLCMSSETQEGGLRRAMPGEQR